MVKTRIFALTYDVLKSPDVDNTCSQIVYHEHLCPDSSMGAIPPHLWVVCWRKIDIVAPKAWEACS